MTDSLSRVRALLKILRNAGSSIQKIRGSHGQLKHLRKKGTVTIAGKPNTDVPPGTLNAILEQAGLK